MKWNRVEHINELKTSDLSEYYRKVEYISLKSKYNQGPQISDILLEEYRDGRIILKMTFHHMDDKSYNKLCYNLPQFEIRE